MRPAPRSRPRAGRRVVTAAPLAQCAVDARRRRRAQGAATREARPRAPTRALETGRALDDRPATSRARAHGPAARRLPPGDRRATARSPWSHPAPRGHAARAVSARFATAGRAPPPEAIGAGAGVGATRHPVSPVRRAPDGERQCGSETAIPSRLAAPWREVTPRAATGTPRGPRRFRAARRHRRSRVQRAGRTPRREPRRAASRRRPEARG